MSADGAGARAPQISVVLPAHNEEELLRSTVGDVVDGLRARHATFEVLILENGSTDATRTIAAELARDLPEVTALVDDAPDYGRALRRGLLTAQGEVVVNFDVDYYDLEFLDAAVAAVRAGAGIVVGTKRGVGAQDERPWPRRLVTGIFSTILRVVFGLRVSDTHGMKALHRERIAQLAERCQLGSDLFDTELVLRAERAGMVVSELPVRVVERRPARSPIARRILRTIVGLARLRRALRSS